MPEIIEGKNYLSAREAADVFSCTPDYISKLAREGKIAGKKIGKAWFVDESSVLRHLARVSVEKEKRKKLLSEERARTYHKLNGQSAKKQSSAERPSPYVPYGATAARLFATAIGLSVFALAFTVGSFASQLSFESIAKNSARERAAVAEQQASDVVVRAYETQQFAERVRERIFTASLVGSANIHRAVGARDGARTPAFSFERAEKTPQKSLPSFEAPALSFSMAALAAWHDRFTTLLASAWAERRAIAAVFAERLTDAPEHVARGYVASGEHLLAVSSTLLATYDRTLQYSADGILALGNAPRVFREGVRRFDDATTAALGSIDTFNDVFDLTTKTTTRTYTQVSSWPDAVREFFASFTKSTPVVVEEDTPPEASEPAVTERVIERTPTTIVQNVTESVTISGITETEFERRLLELERRVIARIPSTSGAPGSAFSGGSTTVVNYNTFANSQKIDQLDGVTITNPTIIGGSISGTSGLGGGGASALSGLSDVSLSSPANGEVLLYDGSDWVNVATSSLGIIGGGGASFGQGWEITNGALTPTTTVGVLVSASSTISALSVETGTTTNATSTNLFTQNFTLGSVNGLLKATNGVVSAATAGVDYLTNAFRNWTLTTNTFGQSALAPTTTQNIAVSGVGTSTFAGGLEAWRQIAAPYFHATSTSATSTFAGGVQVGSGTYLLANGRVGVNAEDPNALFTTEYSFAGTNPFSIRDGSNTVFQLTSSGYLTFNPGYGYGAGSVVNFGNNAGSISGSTSYFVINPNSATDSSYLFRVQEGGTDQLTVRGDGNIGIGTSSPFAKLSVAGQTVADYFTATSTQGAGTSTLPYTNISGALNLFGTYATALSDLCEGITGGVGLCDGTDNTGGGAGLATSTDVVDTYVIYGTSASDVGAEAAFTYDDATDILTVVNASTTALSAYSAAFGSTATSSFSASGVLSLAGLSSSGLGVNANGAVYAAATTTFSSPLIYAAGNVTIQDAVADGSTKGAATFTAADFNDASGVISLDYANGQEATSGQDGFLSSTDWTTFNNKLSSYDAWSHLTTYGETASATTTPLWLQDTLYASSTAFFHDDVTFNSTITTNLSAGGVAVNGAGALYTFSTSTWTFASSTLLTDDNTFSGSNTFTALPILGSLSGVLYGNSGSLAAAATSTATLGLGLSGTLTTLGASDALSIATSTLYTGTPGQVLAYLNGGWTGVATTTFSSGLTYSGGNVTADLGTAITASEMANDDHGFFSYSSGIASLDTGGLSSANLADALTNESGSAGVFARFNLAGQAYGDLVIWDGGDWVNVATSSLNIAFADLTGSATDAQVDNDITLTNITQITNRAISDTTGTLAATRGGTGLSTTASSSLLFGAPGNTWIQMATSSLGVALSDTTGTLSVARGGTGATTLNNLITLGTHTTGNYLATLSSSGSITVGNSGSESAAATVNLNLGNTNAWTALQTFTNASSSLFSAYQAFFGATATSTFDGAGNLALAGTLTIDSQTFDSLTDDATLSNSGGDLQVVDVTCTDCLTATEIDESTLGFLSSYDAWTHPAYGGAATTSIITTTGGLIVNAASSTVAGNLSIDGTATSTNLAVTGTASTSALVASNSFTFSNVSGFLKATAGVVATALIDLANDVTGILAVANGGTGWGNIQSNTLLLGNGTNQLATTSAGTNGQILALVGGTPSWVATTTFSSPLIYASGNVTIQDAVADGSTKGASTFTAADFNDASGVISLDYANGQEATSGQDGFLSSTDWSTFNSKQGALTFGSQGQVPYTNSGTDDYDYSSAFTFDGTKLTATYASTTAITSSGSAYFATSGGNVGIGTTSPNASLQVVSSSLNYAGARGNISVESTGVHTTVQVLSDPTSLGRFVFGDTSNGFVGSVTYDHSDNSMSFIASGSEKARITSAGNVGIGTTSPYAKLHVTNQSAVAGLTAANGGADEFVVENGTAGFLGISILGTDSATTQLLFGSPSDDSGAGVKWAHDDDLFQVGTLNGGGELALLYDNGSEGLRIDSSGLVGIGTTTPSSLLHLYANDGEITLQDSNTSGSSGIQWIDGDGDDVALLAAGTGQHYIELWPDNARAARFEDDGDVTFGDSGSDTDYHFEIEGAGTSGYLAITNSTEGDVLTINSSGDVGIGTTTPQATLNVDDSFAVSRNHATCGAAMSIFNAALATDGWTIKNSNGNCSGTGNLVFIEKGVTGNERFTLEAGGDVGIKTTSPSADLHILDSFANIKLEDSDTSGYAALSTDNSQSLRIEADGSGAQNNSNITLWVDGSERVRLDDTGNLGLGTTSPYAKLSVVGETVSAYFTATTTATSTLPQLDSTGIQISGHLDIDGTISFDSVTGSAWSDFCEAITGSAGLCDGDDAAGAGGGAFAWTPTTYAGAAVNATSTPLWLTGTTPFSLIASSTFATFASSTQLTTTGNTYLATDGGSVVVGDTFAYSHPFEVHGSDSTTFSDSDSVIGGGSGAFIQVANTDNTAGNEAGIIFRANNGLAAAWALYTKETGEYIGDLVFRTRTGSNSSAERLRITNDGNVGIGTTTPWAQLSVEGQGSKPGFVVSDTSNNTDFIVTESGLVGIGQTAPVSKLHITNTSPGNVTDAIALHNSSTLAGSGARLNFSISTSVGGYTAYVEGVRTNNPGSSASYLAFGTHNSSSLGERMRITESGNVGIGTTTPAALLHLSSGSNAIQLMLADQSADDTAKDGWLTVQAYDTAEEPLGVIKGRSNSGALSYVDIGGDRTVGGVVNAATSIAFFTSANATTLNGTERMRIDEDGNVGIGTTSPDAKFHIYQGASNATAGSSADDFILEGSGSTGASILVPDGSFGIFNFGDDGDGSAAGLSFDSTTDNLSFKADGAIRAHLSDDQLYFFGTTGANFRITDGSGGDFRAGIASGVPYVGAISNTDLNIRTNNSNRITILSTGNVGIGDASPLYDLTIGDGDIFGIDASGSTLNAVYSIAATSTIVNNTSYAWTLATSTTAAPLFEIDTTSGAEEITIGSSYSSSADILIGDEAGSGDANFQFANDDDAWSVGFNSSDKSFRIASSTNFSSNVALTITKGAALNVGIGTTSPWRTLSVNGTVSFNGLTLNTGAATASVCLSSTNDVTRNTDAETCIASSERFKENIETLDLDGSLIDLLRPVSFEYKNQPGETRYGFIAEEVEALDPLLVSYDDGGLPNGIRWSHLTTLSVQAIQKINGNLTALTGGTASSTDSFVDSFFSRIAEWLADTANGITSIFAEKVSTRELCVSDASGAETCLTKAQLDALIANAASGASGSSSSSSSGGQSSSSGGNEDTEAPTLTINGNNPAEVEIGASYSDLGALVSDNVDQNLGIATYLDGTEVQTVTIDTSEPGTYTVRYEATDQAGNTGSIERTVIVGGEESGETEEEPQPEPDTVAPTITLIGASAVTVVEEEAYSDEGATATDDVDGDITTSIVVSNPVDTSTPGTYSVTYNVSDAAGNPASEVVRTVVVEALPEPEPPVEEEETATSTPQT